MQKRFTFHSISNASLAIVERLKILNLRKSKGLIQGNVRGRVKLYP